MITRGKTNGAFFLEGVHPGDSIMIQATIVGAGKCTPQGSFMLSTIVPDDVEKNICSFATTWEVILLLRSYS